MLDTLTLAKQLINIKSVTPMDNGCQKIISGILSSLNFEIADLQCDNVSNLWATWGKSGPLFAFSGHTDTVPAGSSRQWRSDPFTATEYDGELYGRGAADMKSAIAAMVCAIEEFIIENKKIRFKIGVMITSDEEGEALNGTRKIVEYLKNINTKPDWCLIGEATSLETLGDSVKVGRRGSLHGELHLNGKQGHIAYPQLADNPIHRCFKALDALTQTEWDKGNEHFAPTSFQIYHIHADTGASNLIPGSLSTKFNFRFSPESNAQSLREEVHQTLDTHGLDYTLNWDLSSTPFMSKPGKLLQAVKDSIRTECKISTTPNTAGGTSDGRFISQLGCEIVEVGPINASIHQVNEKISIKELYQLKDVYKAILTNINHQLQNEEAENAILAYEI